MIGVGRVNVDRGHNNVYHIYQVDIEHLKLTIPRAEFSSENENLKFN